MCLKVILKQVPQTVTVLINELIREQEMQIVIFVFKMTYLGIIVFTITKKANK